MFVDIAKIKIKSGNGGDGAVSFHRDISTRCRNKAPLSQDGEWAPVSYGGNDKIKVFRKTAFAVCKAREVFCFAGAG